MLSSYNGCLLDVKFGNADVEQEVHVDEVVA